MEDEEISSSSSLLRAHTRMERSDSRDEKISITRQREGESEEEEDFLRGKESAEREGEREGERENWERNNSGKSERERER